MSEDGNRLPKHGETCAAIKYNEKPSHQPTKQVKQVRQRTWPVWSAGLSNDDSLAQNLKQYFICRVIKRDYWNKMSMKTFLTHNTTHLLSTRPQGSSWLRKKRKTCPQPGQSRSKRSSRSVAPGESDQVRYMRVGGGGLWNLCGKVSVLECLWLLLDIQQQVTSMELSQRVGAWGRRLRS